jgi:hypothetical protein
MSLGDRNDSMGLYDLGIDYERLAEEIVKRLPPPLPPVCPCPAPYYPVYPQPYYPWWPGITWTTTTATNVSIDTSAGA